MQKGGSGKGYRNVAESIHEPLSIEWVLKEVVAVVWREEIGRQC
jgi:hypothetical protein